MKPYNAKSWEVRAFLNGEKTSIVLPIKPQPEEFERDWGEGRVGVSYLRSDGFIGYNAPVPGGYRPCILQAPYQVGGLICIRETCELVLPDCEGDPIQILYSDGAKQDTPKDCPAIIDWINGEAKRSPAQMPKWASRITLTVVEVKAVRLHDLTGDEIRHIGIDAYDPFCDGCDCLCANYCKAYGQKNFTGPWNERYAKQGLDWDANPWVWVVKAVKA